MISLYKYLYQDLLHWPLLYDAQHYDDRWTFKTRPNGGFILPYPGHIEFFDKYGIRRIGGFDE